MSTKEISKVSVEKALAFIESGIYTKKPLHGQSLIW